ncbi:hypothetical protein M3Y94_00449200 [Aphelenchoides besseyi]|nr:hypothetical protein M3Y94_00449200 [Aphelenchoides besseyi]
MELLLIVLVISFSTFANSLNRVEFLIRNQELCGDLFAEAQWIPVLDICELKCKDDEVCVENDELTQKCSKLPERCVEKWNQLSKRPQVSGVKNRLSRFRSNFVRLPRV